jgi:hypothetical protein
MPYMPLSFTRFGETLVAAGLETDEKLYLAVWNLDRCAKEVSIPLLREVNNVSVSYPADNRVDCAVEGNCLKVQFPNGKMARFFEIIKGK